MNHFSYRLALTTLVLALSLAWWTGVAAAKPYIDSGPATGVSEVATDPAGGGGFDWVDAGIGAATTAGLVLVAGGAGVLVLRHRRSAAFS